MLIIFITDRLKRQQKQSKKYSMTLKNMDFHLLIDKLKD